jgi:hypothetical protein
MTVAGACALMLSACTNGQVERPNGFGDHNPDEFWPVHSLPIALVLDREELHITDGRRVVGLGLSTSGVESTHLAVVRRGDRLFANVHEQIASIDLRTGEVDWRPCESCSGLTSTSEGLATILRDGTLLIFDESLAQIRSTSVAGSIGQGPPPVPAAFEEPDWQPGFVVMEGPKDAVLIGSRPWWGGARYGPTLISALAVDGSLRHEREATGVFAAASMDSRRESIVVQGWGSSGACNTATSLTLLPIEGDEGDRQDLLTDDYFVTTDWSWNGRGLVVVGYATETAGLQSGGCALSQWQVLDLATPEGASAQPQATRAASAGIVQLRVLEGCDNLLATIDAGTGRQLYSVRDGQLSAALGEYSIAWTAPPSNPCRNVVEASKALQ